MGAEPVSDEHCGCDAEIIQQRANVRGNGLDCVSALRLVGGSGAAPVECDGAKLAG